MDKNELYQLENIVNEGRRLKGVLEKLNRLENDINIVLDSLREGRKEYIVLEFAVRGDRTKITLDDLYEIQAVKNLIGILLHNNNRKFYEL